MKCFQKSPQIVCLALVFLLLFSDGCTGAQISPEDAAKANEYGGQSCDIPIEIHVGDMDLTAPRQGEILETDMREYPFDILAGWLFDLTQEQVEKQTESHTYEDEWEKMPVWSKILREGESRLMVAQNGHHCSYVLSSSDSNLYRAAASEGRITGYGYNRVFLMERFPQEDLDGLPASQVEKQCNELLDAMGVEEYSVDIYAMTLESLKMVGEQYDIRPEGREWTKEDECYLLLYRRYMEDLPIFSIDGGDILIFYSPERGILCLQTEFWHGNVRNREKVDLVTPQQALLQIPALVSGAGLTGQNLEVTEIRLGYVAKNAQQNETTGKGSLTPCYEICYVLTDMQEQKREGRFLVDAVTGYGITWNSQ